MILQDFHDRYPDRAATLALVDTSAGFGSASAEVRREFLARRLEPLERGLTPTDIAPEVVEVLVAKGATPEARQRMCASMEALRVDFLQASPTRHRHHGFPCRLAAHSRAGAGDRWRRRCRDPTIRRCVSGSADPNRPARIHSGSGTHDASRKTPKLQRCAGGVPSSLRRSRLRGGCELSHAAGQARLRAQSTLSVALRGRSTYSPVSKAKARILPSSV